MRHYQAERRHLGVGPVQAELKNSAAKCHRLTGSHTNFSKRW